MNPAYSTFSWDFSYWASLFIALLFQAVINIVHNHNIEYMLQKAMAENNVSQSLSNLEKELWWPAARHFLNKLTVRGISW